MSNLGTICSFESDLLNYSVYLVLIPSLETQIIVNNFSNQLWAAFPKSIVETTGANSFSDLLGL